jgi:hypothetical protein
LRCNEGENYMKDYRTFLMIGALCAAACGTDPVTSSGSMTTAGTPGGAVAGMTGTTAGTPGGGAAGTPGGGAAGKPAGAAGGGAVGTAGGPASGGAGMTASGGAGGSSSGTAGMSAAAGSGGMSSGGAAEGTWQYVYEKLKLQTQCGSCHSMGVVIGSPDFSQADKAYDTLVDKDATMMQPGQCGGMGKLVVAGDCENSLFYNKVAEDMPKCGRHMPPGPDNMPTRLPEEDLKALCDWIMAGAKK